MAKEPMDCQEARQRLDGPRPKRDSAALRKHLATCPECAAEAEGSQELNQLLETAAVDDSESVVPIAQQRARIERRLSGQHRPPIYRRVPGYALGFATVAIVFMTLFLAPSENGEVVGYDLSIDGVSEELATDSERICDMLFALGAINAGVDVAACDSDCQVIIFDLRTREEVRLVEAAIRNLSTGTLTTDVIPQTVRTTDS